MMKNFRFIILIVLFLRIVYGVFGSDSKENYYSIGAHLSADGFSRILKTTANDLLLIPDIQGKINSMSFVSLDLNADVLLEELVVSMNSSFSKYVDALQTVSEALSKEHKRDAAKYRFYKELTDCSRISKQSSRFDTYSGGNLTCCTTQTKDTAPFYYPDTDIIRVLGSSTRLAGVRGSFIIGGGGGQLECPAKHIPIHRKEHWKEYIHVVSSKRKNVVILLDVVSLSSEVQLIRLKTAAKILLEAAGTEDRYSVVASTASGVISNCDSNIRRLRDFIDHLRLSTQVQNSSHSDLFKAAFKVLKNENTGNFDSIIQYVSRGLLSELGEATRVMETIVIESADSKALVKINTFAITDENRMPMLWTTEFLHNIATQNYAPYKGFVAGLLAAKLNDTEPERITGELVVLNASEHNLLRLHRMSSLLDVPDSKISREPLWTLSEDSGKIMFSVSLPSFFPDQFLSYVSGLDIDLDMVADAVRSHVLIQLAPAHADLVVYLTDEYGRVVVGSSASTGSWLFHAESWPSSSKWVLKDLKREDSDRGEFNIQRENGRSNYLWRKIPNVPLVVVIRSSSLSLPTKVQTLQSEDRQLQSMEHLVYHRMDLQRDPSLSFCSNYGGLSVHRRGSLYLSPYTLEPTARQLQPSSQLTVNYWVYLSDRIGLIRSSAIRPGVREEVGALAKLTFSWTDMLTASESPGVIRRYIASRRGVMVTVPAAVVTENLDPTEEIWFTRAVSNLGRIVFSGPYADPQLGDVVTLSTVVYKPSKQGTRTSENEVFGVVAVDITTIFFRQLIEKSIPACQEGRKCVVISSSGDVLAESTKDFPALIVDAVERFHVGHVEPLLATHLLSESKLVRKWQCVEKEGRVRRREYSINTTFTRVHTVSCGGDAEQRSMPIQSEVLLVPGTDIFLALMNSTCTHNKDIGAFCPCSVSDRRCLFCARFDPMECECPCQCNSRFDNTCHLASSSEELPLCGPLRPARSFVVVPPKLNLPPCHKNDCNQLRSRSQCTISIGCEWCSLDSSLTPLLVPFCSATATCYQGVKGRNVIKHPSLTGIPSSSRSPSTPIGLIVGVVVFMFIGLVIAVYSCYRSKIGRISIDARGSSDSFGVPLFSKGTGDGEFTFDHEGIGPNTDKIIVLASFERSARSRRGAGTSSDLGYSTMTEKNHSTINGDTESEAGGATSVFREPLKGGYLRDDTASSIVTTEVDVHRPPNLIMSN